MGQSDFDCDFLHLVTRHVTPCRETDENCVLSFRLEMYQSRMCQISDPFLHRLFSCKIKARPDYSASWLTLLMMTNYLHLICITSAWFSTKNVASNYGPPLISLICNWWYFSQTSEVVTYFYHSCILYHVWKISSSEIKQDRNAFWIPYRRMKECDESADLKAGQIGKDNKLLQLFLGRNRLVVLLS